MSLIDHSLCRFSSVGLASKSMWVAHYASPSILRQRPGPYHDAKVSVCATLNVHEQRKKNIV